MGTRLAINLRGRVTGVVISVVSVTDKIVGFEIGISERIGRRGGESDGGVGVRRRSVGGG